MTEELEMRIIEQMNDIVLRAGEEVVKTDDIVTLGEQTLAQMRAEETGTAGDEHTFSECVVG